jgi:hypothetical protein
VPARGFPFVPCSYSTTSFWFLLVISGRAAVHLGLGTPRLSWFGHHRYSRNRLGSMSLLILLVLQRATRLRSWCSLLATRWLSLWSAGGHTLPSRSVSAVLSDELFCNAIPDCVCRCVAAEKGQVYTWGCGQSGRLGLGSTSDQLTPQHGASRTQRVAALADSVFSCPCSGVERPSHADHQRSLRLPSHHRARQ